MCNFLLFYIVDPPEKSTSSEDDSVLGGISNDTPIFVEQGLGSVVSELTLASASASTCELHLQVLGLGSPLIPVTEIDTSQSVRSARSW